MFDEGLFKIFSEEPEQQSEQHSSSAVEEIESIDFGKKTVVLSVGGSLVVQEKPNTSYIAKLAERISNLYKSGYRFAIVVGGGVVCRNYIASAKALGANNFLADSIGIRITRLNAMLMIQALENAYPKVLTDVFQAKPIIDSGKIPVYGGLLPGITTDCVAALVAEYLGAEFINLTNVDGVYSADPKVNPHAKFYPEISYDRLLSLIKLAGSKPGQNVVLDLPACLILKRSNIPAIVLNGNDLDNFVAAVEGAEFRGTRIMASEQA